MDLDVCNAAHIDSGKADRIADLESGHACQEGVVGYLPLERIPFFTDLKHQAEEDQADHEEQAYFSLYGIGHVNSLDFST